MTKKASKRKARTGGPSVEERALRVERQLLERVARHQRKVRELARRVQRETAAADAAMRELVRWGLERFTPSGTVDEQRDHAETT